MSYGSSTNNTLVYQQTNPNQPCTLTDQQPVKAYPSLIKCYRNNVNACCVSAHDDYITKAMADFLPNSCQRKYAEMEQYFCYGCHYTEPTATYTDTTNKVINICYDYAVRIWGGDLTQPTTIYDDCGVNSYWANNTEVYIPSLLWGNATDFFNTVLPPFFDDFRIVI